MYDLKDVCPLLVAGTARYSGVHFAQVGSGSQHGPQKCLDQAGGGTAEV